MPSVYIVAAKRTPFGAFGGKLKEFSAVDLGVHSAVATLASIPKDVPISSVIYGNVLQTSSDTPYLARHVGLRAELPIATPALTVNRLCGSGFQSLINGAHEILLGESEIVLTGGSESMSQAPFTMKGTSRFGIKYGQSPVLEDSLVETLTDKHISTPMGITAENLAKKYHITRKECDELALRSQSLWNEANLSARFHREIAPIEIETKKGIEIVNCDEHPRKTTMESLAKLPNAFIKGGTVTAGNASGICDGAASVLIASSNAIQKFNLKPLAKVVSWGIVGVNPSEMGIGPVNAIKMALEKANLKLQDMDIVEINEAFAAQYIAVEKELGLDRSKVNLQGGAIALGHPLAASGSRILGHLAHELQITGKKYAIGAACIGGGQGIAVILQNTN